MKTFIRFALLALLCAINSPLSTSAQGTAFTYQGRLLDNGAPANGTNYGMVFHVYNAATGGSSLGNLGLGSVTVSNGLFTVPLDFGNVFDGSPRWLEVQVQKNGGAFAPLSPRQALTPSPYSLYAPNAGAAATAVSATTAATATTANGVAPGSVGTAGLALGAVDSSRLADGSITTAKVQDGSLTAADVAPNTFWKLGGNSGSTPGTHFLGTTDNMPLELRVQGRRALRLEPGNNIVAGAGTNLIAAGIQGAVIAGGGQDIMGGYSYPNSISADYAVIGGGSMNQIGGMSQGASIGGGFKNTIQAFAMRAVIGGGWENSIRGGSAMWDSVSTIAGGGFNLINSNASGSVIGGGWDNTIGTNAYQSSIGGGRTNTVSAPHGTIAGGLFNRVTGGGAFIGGGGYNGDNSLIDFGNTASGMGSVIGGGSVNTAGGSRSVIGGGHSNATTNQYATVPGGAWNLAGGQGSLAAGRAAKAVHDGTFVWSDDWTPDFVSTANKQFLIRAGGGVGIGTNNPQAALHVAGTVRAEAFISGTNTPASFGSVGIGTVTPQDALLDVEGNVRLNDFDLFLRGGSDRNHGLGWYGASKLFAGVNIDGPVLYGWSGGGLGTSSSTNLALRWTSDGNVAIDPLGQNNSGIVPGLTFGASSGEGIASKRTAGGNQYGLDFFTSYQNRMSITQSGNVGIGTNNPQTALHVVGTVTAGAFQGSGVVNWSPATATSVAMESNRGYVATNDLVPTIFTLPAAPALGDIVRVTGGGLGTWRISQNAGQRIRTRTLGGPAGNNWAARASSRAWTGIAASADGINVAACVNGGNIYTSTNSGASWVSRASSKAWNSIASSSDGVRLAACVYGEYIYTSTDSGANWVLHAAPRNWEHIASSADGTKLVACPNTGNLWTSSDAGTNWVSRDSSRAWYSVASSADGTKLAAVVFNGQIYTSSNSGTNWTARDSVRYWTGVASSADGTKLTAVVSDGNIYTSTDSGVTWTPRSESAAYTCVTTSADGTRSVAGSTSWLLYVSTDSGIAWTRRETSRNWSATACSADGSKMYACVNSGQIYASISETTSGTTGFVSGDVDTSIELQFTGNNVWMALSHEGTILFN